MKDLYIVVHIIATNSQHDGVTYEVFDDEKSAFDYIIDMGEHYAVLSEIGGWECHEEWTDDGKNKLEFEYYTTKDARIDKSVSCKLEIGHYNQKED